MVNNIKKSIFTILIAAVAGFAGAGAYNKFYESETVTQPSGTEKSVPARLANYNRTPSPTGALEFVEASESTVPAVVHVTTTYGATSSNNQSYNPFQDFFWGDRGSRNPTPAMSSGSGVIISEDGYIVTNNHVVANSDKVEITLNDKRTLLAKVIGTDPSTDLALLKIDEKGLPFIPYGNSDVVRVGEWVLAVGNPFNLTSTVTAGIVSAKARNIHILPDQQFPIESFIQTDAAVNPGNSGGALVNTNGDLIGINTAIASNTGAYTGYSFAIPVNMVKKVVDDLLEYGNVQRGFIGVNIRDIDSKFAVEKGIKSLKGVYVAGITEGGAAASAGIREGDIITKISGNNVNTSPELQEQVSRFRPGDKVEVTLVREGDEKTVLV
ncbi:MAG: trypsin-like peptidase domain-containing protein, partial [Flavisolibacter sp.]|nr:trypsin-like peptidase domain-containing protein [Flavisolibacter sp.]